MVIPMHAADGMAWKMMMQYKRYHVVVVFMLTMMACHAAWTAPATTTTVVDGGKAGVDKGPTVLNFLWSMVNVVVTGEKSDYTKQQQQVSSPQPQSPPSPQPLFVIGAGLPRTGTLSFTMAMKKLGIRVYHMTEGVAGTPGHIDLWYRHYVVDHGTSVVSKNEILTEIAARGFNGTADAPSCFAFQQAMERYPNAKVVLNVRRGHGDENAADAAREAWKDSFASTILAFMYILQKIPFRWSTPLRKFEILHRFMLQQEFHGIEMDPVTLHVVEDQLPAAYHAWVNKVKRIVPAEKLLVHAAQDGWPPLCNFLSSSSLPSSASSSSTTLPITDNNSIQSKCNAILESGEPYPHANDNAKIHRLLFFLQVVNQVFEKGPLLILLLAGSAVFLVIYWKRRKGQRRLQQQERMVNKTK